MLQYSDGTLATCKAKAAQVWCRGLGARLLLLLLSPVRRDPGAARLPTPRAAAAGCGAGVPAAGVPAVGWCRGPGPGAQQPGSRVQALWGGAGVQQPTPLRLTQWQQGQTVSLCRGRGRGRAGGVQYIANPNQSAFCRCPDPPPPRQYIADPNQAIGDYAVSNACGGWGSNQLVWLTVSFNRHLKLRPPHLNLGPPPGTLPCPSQQPLAPRELVPPPRAWLTPPAPAPQGTAHPPLRWLKPPPPLLPPPSCAAGGLEQLKAAVLANKVCGERKCQFVVNTGGCEVEVVVVCVCGACVCVGGGWSQRRGGWVGVVNTGEAATVNGGWGQPPCMEVGQPPACLCAAPAS